MTLNYAASLARIHACQMFTSSEYSEAEMLVKHILNKVLSLIQLLPPEIRTYELNHSVLSILNLS